VLLFGSFLAWAVVDRIARSAGRCRAPSGRAAVGVQHAIALVGAWRSTPRSDGRASVADRGVTAALSAVFTPVRLVLQASRTAPDRPFQRASATVGSSIRHGGRAIAHLHFCKGTAMNKDQVKGRIDQATAPSGSDRQGRAHKTLEVKGQLEKSVARCRRPMAT